MSGTRSTDGGARGGAVLTRPLAGTAVFVALAVALGLALVAVPNVELLTFTIFAAGVFLGRARGALVGILAGAIFSGLNPMGSALGIPTLFVAQVVAWAFAGFAGGATSSVWLPTGAAPTAALRVMLGAGAGLTLTLVYQCAVIFGLALSGLNVGVGLAAAVIANAFFSLIHIVSNTVLFAALAPAALPRLALFAFARGAREEGK